MTTAVKVGRPFPCGAGYLNNWSETISKLSVTCWPKQIITLLIHHALLAGIFLL